MNNILRFFKSGMKSLKRERFFAGINILGLAIGMFCFIITSLYVRDELTHDQWHENADDIYLAKIEYKTGGNGGMFLLPPFPYGKALMDESPGVINQVNISLSKTAEYSVKEETFETSSFYYSEKAIFEMFDFELALGNEETALSDPNNIVISERLSRKHFKKQNPLGEFIEIKDEGTFKVTGVLKNISSNSHLYFDFIAPINTNKGDYNGMANNWQFGNGLIYLQLEPGYSLDKLSEDADRMMSNKGGLDFPKEYSFSRFSELYLNQDTWRSTSADIFAGQMKYIYIFSLIGGLLLLVACFNYINLTTARSIARSKEMVIRKIVGASRGRLILQNIGETTFLSGIALCLAFIATELSLPGINEMLGKRLNLDFLGQPDLWLLPALLIMLVIIISGIYPAVVSSTFNLSVLLKGINPSSNKSLIRKSLLVLQFLICTGLLSSGLIIRGQANHMIKMDLGYNSQNVMSIDVFEGGFGNKYNQLRTELERIPQIEMVSGSPLPNVNGAMMLPVGEKEEQVTQMFSFGSADKDFVELFELEMIDGTSFNNVPESSLKSGALINESAVELLNLENPVGTVLGEAFTVLGVIKDFHYSSAKSEIGPMLITCDTENVRNMHFRFKASDKENVLAQVKAVWESFETEKPFEVESIDQFFAGSYRREETLVQIFDLLTGMLALIAFMGLFALSTFENQLKEKQMSIRKVLGAGYFTLIKVMNRQFLLLVLLSLLIATPITKYLIEEWLSSFPYRLESVWPYFLVSIAAVLITTIGVLSMNGFINAKKNPVDILRNE